MEIEDVIHYVPVVGSAISSDGRFVVASTPVLRPELPLRPVLTRVMDLDAPRAEWKFIHPGPNVESFYNPSIAPDSRRIAAFRYSDNYLDVAIADLSRTQAEPISLKGIPELPNALKWRGLPGELTCLGSDSTGTRRIWVWENRNEDAVPLTPPQRSVFDYAFCPHGGTLAWIEAKRTDTPHALLHVSDDRGLQGRTFSLPGTPVGFLSFSPDGNRVAFMGRPEGERLARPEIWVVDLENNGEVKHLTAGVPGWFTGYDWNRSGTALVTASDEGIHGKLLHIPLHSERVEVIHADHEDYLSGPRLDRERGQLLFLRQNSDRPQQLCLQKGKQGKIRVLSRFNRKFEQLQKVGSERIAWSGRDGLALEGLWMQPNSPGPHPALVWLHGGPAEHINKTFSTYFQSFVTAGWAVFAPNYRGSTGQDNRYLRANVNDLCGEDVYDVLTGMNVLEERGYADPAHWAAMGWSYGGSLGLSIAAQSSLLKALVVVAPVTDWVSIFGAQTYPAITPEYFPAPYYENRAVHDARSPITHAKSISVPTLFLHGALDPLVPPSQSVMMERALRLQGVKTDFHLVPGEYHVFIRPASILWMLHQVHDWIAKHASPKPD